MNVFKVTMGEDSPEPGLPGSLRYAINSADTATGSNKIIITKHVKVINVTETFFSVSNSMEIVNETEHDVHIKSTITQGIFNIRPNANINSVKIDGGKHKIIIENGSATTSPYQTGGAVFCGTFNNTLLLKNVVFKNCQATNMGGAIYTLGHIMMESCGFYNNSAGQQGGAIWAQFGVSMKNSKLKGNSVTVVDSSSSGGAIFIDNSNLVVDHSVISGNQCAYTDSAGGAGGAITMMQGDIHITNKSKINHNKAFDSAAILQGVGNVWITKGSQVNQNQSFDPNNAQGGGGVTITKGAVLVSDSEVCDNKTVGMLSGGIVSILGDVIVQNSKINGNTNQGPGGAIACNFDSSLIVSGSEVIGNTGASLGGAFVNFSMSTGIIEIHDSIIKDNVLTNAQTIGGTIAASLEVITGYSNNMTAIATLDGLAGGLALIATLPGILVLASQVHTALSAITSINGVPVAELVGGGAVGSILLAPVTVTNSKITGNKAGVVVSQTNVPVTSFGGGIFCMSTPTTLDSSCISHNHSTGSGGGLYIGSSLDSRGSQVCGNEVKNETPSSSQNGGGIFNDVNTVINLLDTNVEDNKTNSYGGGLANLGLAKLIDSKIKHNHAKAGDDNVYSTGTIYYL